MVWVLWFLLLVLQNASFTLVSRARNSDSLFYHALASIPSNGVWFLSQFILIDNMVRIIRDSDWWFGVLVGAVYVVGTMTGSLGMHWIALHHIEKKSAKPAVRYVK